MAQELTGSTGNGPYIQFENCNKNGVTCKYKDVSGKCIWESCIYDERPENTVLWFYECVICKETDCVDPKEMKVHFCKMCISRMQAVEALPVSCRWCGESIDSPPSWMFSGLCEKCLGKIQQAAYCGHCGRDT